MPFKCNGYLMGFTLLSTRYNPDYLSPLIAGSASASPKSFWRDNFMNHRASQCCLVSNYQRKKVAIRSACEIQIMKLSTRWRELMKAVQGILVTVEAL